MIHIQDEQKEFFDKEGYLVLSDVYPQQYITLVMEEYERIRVHLLQNKSILQNRDKPLFSLYPRLRDYHKKNSIVADAIFKTHLFDLMAEIIGEEPLLISTSYYFKSPDTPGLPMHQDNYAFGVTPGTTYAAWISLDGSDHENGGLTFIKGSQKMKLIQPKTKTNSVREYFSDAGQKVEIDDPDQIINVQTKPGDIVIFNGRIIHGSTKNESSYRFRRSLIGHFTGASVERLALNFNWLYNRYGEKVRRRLNKNTKITEKYGTVFSIKQAHYFEDWR
ncbi:phytanoyl-CoA dioxygenase family protein [Fictibacillus sp. KIGAM418]|uniref:Phytanoyl-CoA dioxygenase family protein n=1 Tax=Fictibacillus marinisediminis TaxID=2878389 RepID=A0A9X1XKX3_9BACL|nr:phytanoyl-CoA dioxygenase family protein [Fictibacillus marinisediminis]MCK6259424.1 phytanoyl-CoA dioxygenase family protein [Fictibacillus marinisediminis]